MNLNTVSGRNLIGAFVGGFVGILTFAYVHPALMLFACAIGVIGGWWYREIWQATVDSFHRGLVRSQQMGRRLKTFVLTPAKQLREQRFNVGPLVAVCHGILFLIVWVLRRPVAFRRWLRAHPMNQAYVLRGMALAINFGLNLLWLIPLVVHWCRWQGSMSSGDVRPVAYLFGLFGLATVALVIPAVGALPGSASDMRKFYTIWERYDRRTPVHFFLGELWGLCRLELFIVMTLAVGLAMMTGVGVLFMAFTVVLSASFGTVKAFYRVATRPGHWLCLGVTLVVTMIVANQLRSYMLGPVGTLVIWVDALLAGAASAVMTEVVRLVLAGVFGASPHVRSLATTKLTTRLAPGWQAMAWVFVRFEDWCYNHVPVNV